MNQIRIEIDNEHSYLCRLAPGKKTYSITLEQTGEMSPNRGYISELMNMVIYHHTNAPDWGQLDYIGAMDRNR